MARAPSPDCSLSGVKEFVFKDGSRPRSEPQPAAEWLGDPGVSFSQRPFRYSVHKAPSKDPHWSVAPEDPLLSFSGQ